MHQIEMLDPTGQLIVDPLAKSVNVVHFDYKVLVRAAEPLGVCWADAIKGNR